VTGFFHIRADGTDAYPQRYRYVGDFRTALAVAYGVEGAFHIRKDGSRLNSASYRHAEPFHKGLAVAADEHGFFHVDKSGKQVLSLRLAAAEPFYNGVSLCRGKDGGLIRLRRDGTWNRVAESIEPISVPEVRRRLSEGSCVGLFIRHAERQPITPESPNWGNDVPLTDHGEEQSRCLGKELAVGGVRIGLWASPVARSRQTCEALFAGAGGGVPQVLVHHFLGAPGIYLDGTGAHAGPMRADYTAFVAGYLATGGAPGMRPVPEASEQLLAFLEEKMCDDGCTVFVTHDIFAATLMSYLGLKAPDRSDWCDFLEGVCIIRSGTRREYRRFVALERGMPC
jgi:broad specificity phosphatase PhoE